MGLEPNKVSLGVAVDQLKQENEGLSIQLESTEKDLVEKDHLVREKSTIIEVWRWIWVGL